VTHTLYDLLYAYTKALSFLELLFRELPAIRPVLRFLAEGYVVPTALALVVLIRWFEGARAADRLANEGAVLRSLVVVLAAWGLAGLAGLECRQVLSAQAIEEMNIQWPWWHGLPAPSSAAATGFALAAGLWRRDWRWGLGLCLATGLWATAQVCYGLRYPLDVVVGTALGVGLAWPLGAATWLERPLNAIIHLARRLMLA
jgi:hypothetical protein